MDWKEKLTAVQTEVNSRIGELEAEASTRLNALFDEVDAIYRAFPRLRPKAPRQTRCYTRRGLHWTQKPENREKWAANLQKAHAAKEGKQ